MDNSEHDPGHQFGQLTGLLEDAAGLAAEGQDAEVSTFERHELLKNLTALTNESQSILDTLHTQLDITE